MYSAQAYCTPRSEWWTRLPQGGRRAASAMVEPAAFDEFVRWRRVHDYHEDRLAAPYHVSPAMTGFEELDSYGVWTRNADYGEVWFPEISAGRLGTLSPRPLGVDRAVGLELGR